jgi:hypothetical protein
LHSEMSDQETDEVMLAMARALHKELKRRTRRKWADGYEERRGELAMALAELSPSPLTLLALREACGFEEKEKWEVAVGIIVDAAEWLAAEDGKEEGEVDVEWKAFLEKSELRQGEEVKKGVAKNIQGQTDMGDGGGGGRALLRGERVSVEVPKMTGEEGTGADWQESVSRYRQVLQMAPEVLAMQLEQQGFEKDEDRRLFVQALRKRRKESKEQLTQADVDELVQEVAQRVDRFYKRALRKEWASFKQRQDEQVQAFLVRWRDRVSRMEQHGLSVMVGEGEEEQVDTFRQRLHSRYLALTINFTPSGAPTVQKLVDHLVECERLGAVSAAGHKKVFVVEGQTKRQRGGPRVQARAEAERLDAKAEAEGRVAAGEGDESGEEVEQGMDEAEEAEEEAKDVAEVKQARREAAERAEEPALAVHEREDGANYPRFYVGDYVLRHVPRRGRRKDEMVWAGPMLVTRVWGTANYEVRGATRRKMKVHINDLKRVQLPERSGDWRLAEAVWDAVFAYDPDTDRGWGVDKSKLVHIKEGGLSLDAAMRESWTDKEVWLRGLHWKKAEVLAIREKLNRERPTALTWLVAELSCEGWFRQMDSKEYPALWERVYDEGVKISADGEQIIEGVKAVPPGERLCDAQGAPMGRLAVDLWCCRMQPRKRK